MTRIVCHITTGHDVFDTRVFRRECRSLAQAGYRVYLVAPHTREETVDGVRILPIPVPTSRLARRVAWPLMAARRALATGADLYHFHDPELIPAMQWLARRTAMPVVWDAHEVFYQT
ncbi:MAG TPA: glycosyltransferase, partial [Gemmatimonadales bacterium]|nr:glycosyltransferase [Gemmatimonadales bacterium]